MKGLFVSDDVKTVLYMEQIFIKKGEWKMK